MTGEHRKSTYSDTDWFFNKFPTGVVYVFSMRKSIPRDIKDIIGGATEVIHCQDPWQWPNKTHFYVQRAELTAKAERAAGSMGAQIVVLPEGTDYLAKAIQDILKTSSVYIYLPSKVGDRP